MSHFAIDALERPRAPIEDGEGLRRLCTQTPQGIAVIVCTRGRPEIVAALVEQLKRQSLPPDHVFIIPSGDVDVEGLDREQERLTVRIGRTGSTFQRNDGMALAGSKFEHIVFFDDDFVPSRYWLERMRAIFRDRPDVVGITGRILADGSRGPGIVLQDALQMVTAEDARAKTDCVLDGSFPYGSNVGCNLAFRYSAVRDIAFDERLPLYAWHEDSDFRGQAERRGRVVRADCLWGVHLGHKKGRVRGVTLGYAQIANAVYLANKGTVPAKFLTKIACANVLVNAVRAIRPEPMIDRRGRLRGNIIALADLVRGRLAPERILEL